MNGNALARKIYENTRTQNDVSKFAVATGANNPTHADIHIEKTDKQCLYRVMKMFSDKPEKTEPHAQSTFDDMKTMHYCVLHQMCASEENRKNFAYAWEHPEYNTDLKRHEIWFNIVFDTDDWNDYYDDEYAEKPQDIRQYGFALDQKKGLFEERCSNVARVGLLPIQDSEYGFYLLDVYPNIIENSVRNIPNGNLQKTDKNIAAMLLDTAPFRTLDGNTCEGIMSQNRLGSFAQKVFCLEAAQRSKHPTINGHPFTLKYEAKTDAHSEYITAHEFIRDDKYSMDFRWEDNGCDPIAVQLDKLCPRAIPQNLESDTETTARRRDGEEYGFVTTNEINPKNPSARIAYAGLRDFRKWHEKNIDLVNNTFRETFDVQDGLNQYKEAENELIS